MNAIATQVISPSAETGRESEPTPVDLDTAAVNNSEHAPAPPRIAITIARDLAVQIVGSDAGKARRMKPHSSMTKGATTEVNAAVAELMHPFLLHEILRFHENRSHHQPEHRAEATREQARALKRYCIPYAAHLRKHLDRHEHDDRHHRTQQRLDQTCDVIRQINDALCTPFDDGRTPDDCAREIIVQLKPIAASLSELVARVNATDTPSSPTVRSLMELHRCIQQAVFQTTHPANAAVPANGAANPVNLSELVP